MKKRTKKENQILFLGCFCLFCSSVIFAVAADAPHLPFFIILGTLMIWTIKLSIKMSARTILYTLIAIIMLVAVQNKLLPIESNRFFFNNISLYVPILIYLGMIFLLFKNSELKVGILIGLSILATMLSGNIIANAKTNSNFIGSDFLRENFKIFYGIMVAAQISSILWLLYIAERRLFKKQTMHGSFMRINIRIITCLVIGGFVYFSSKILLHYEREIQSTFSQLLNSKFFRNKKLIFGDNVSLWETLPNNPKTAKKVVLRVEGKEAPGYLRSNAYLSYKHGHWNAVSITKPLTAIEVAGNSKKHIFYRPMIGVKTNDNDKSLTNNSEYNIFITNSVTLKHLPVTGQTYDIELIADSASNTKIGAIIIKGANLSAGYSIRAIKNDGKSCYPYPQKKRGEKGENTMLKHLNLSPKLESKLQKICYKIFGLNYQELTTNEKLNFLSKYFADGFTYTLNFKSNDEEDPVMQFLNDDKSAHCELFATATVLLLRTAGVRARYVTGFVCVEKHPHGDYYISRLSHAHAWAEAYDVEKGCWVLVENTPAGSIPSDKSKLTILGSFFEKLAMIWSKSMAMIKQGKLTVLAIYLLSIARDFLWGLIGNPLGIIIVFCIIAILVKHLLKHHQKTKKPQENRRMIYIQKMNNILKSIEKNLSKYHINRPPAMTLHEFSRYIMANKEITNGDELAKLLAEYQEMRYQSSEPDLKTIQNLHAKVNALL